AQVGAGGGGQAPQPVRGAHWRAGLRAASRSNTIMSAIKTVRVRVVGLIFLLPSNTVSTAIASLAMTRRVGLIENRFSRSLAYQVYVSGADSGLHEANARRRALRPFLPFDNPIW